MATINYTVNAIDSASTTFKRIALSADSLDAQLGDLSKRVATPSVDLSDTKFALAYAKDVDKINKLSAMVATPSASLDTVKIQRQILQVRADLDKLDGKEVTATVKVKTDTSALSRLRGLFGGGGSGGTGGTGGSGSGSGSGGVLGRIGSGIAGAGVQPIAIGAAIVGGTAVAPAAIPTALGAGLGGLGAFLAAPKQFAAAFKDMVSAIEKDVAPLRPLFTTVLGTLPGIARQLGPGLRDVFALSIPYLKAFTSLITPVAKIILPAIAQVLREMTPNLPVIQKSFLAIAEGFALFLDELGPRGIQASAKIFLAFAEVIEAGLAGSGAAANAAAIAFVAIGKAIAATVKYSIKVIGTFTDAATKDFDQFRHDTATIFNGIRHDTAAAWDAIWNNSIGRIVSGISDEHKLIAGMRHDTAGIFDDLRHDLSSIWDAIWNNTVGRAESGVKDVGRAVNGLRNAFATPINWVITNVLDRLIGGFDWITSHIGLGKPIPTIKGLAAGGKLPGFGGGDILPAMLEPGETVVDKNRSRQFAGVFKAMGVPGYASGGVVGNRPPGRFPGLPQPKPGSAPFGGGVLGDIEGFFKGVYSAGRISAAIVSGNSKALTNAFSALLGHGAGGAGGDLAKMLTAIPAALVRDAVKWLISNGGVGSGSGSAIVDYAKQYLGKIPYVFGGTSLHGDDCSGFTQAMYQHFGYNAPRTSEQQGAWVKKSAPTPGGLVFFNSPAGGPPPGHVGIVMNTKGQMISQAGPEGALGPTISGIAGNMFAGVPPGGFAKPGTSAKGRYTLPGLESLWDSAGGRGGITSHIAGAIALAESGGSPIARNPSGASGLWQILGQVVPGNIFNPLINAENAVKKWRDAGGFSPWVTYTSGAYGRFMDSGGTLPTGRSIVYNGTGKPEKLVRDDRSGQTITLEFKTGNGANALDRAIVDVIQKYVIVHGGDTQAALGQRA